MQALSTTDTKCHGQENEKAAWDRGDWHATWYCTECYMLYYNCSYGAVCDILGFSERGAKKARYAAGEA